MKISSICIPSCLAAFAAANSADHEWDTVDSIGSSLERGFLRARGSAEAVVVKKEGEEPSTFLADAAAAKEGLDSAGEGGEPGWYLNNKLDGCSGFCRRQNLECTDHSQLCQTQIDSFEKMEYALSKAGGGLCANEGDPSWDAGAPFVEYPEFGSSGDKTCHPFKMTTYRISSCNDPKGTKTLTNPHVYPLCWCETQTDDDNIPQCDLPYLTEGAFPCEDCRSCVGCYPCDESNRAIIYPRSCKGTDACSRSADINVNQNSCAGSAACRNTRLATIGRHSCNAMYACESASRARISHNSCNAEYACQGAARATIGMHSCNDEHACSQDVEIRNEDEAVEITIGDFSCSAEFACKGRTGNVSHNSCKGVNACMGGSGTIGENACRGDDSCGKGRTGNVSHNSCKGVNACSGGSGTIGENACHGDDSCVGFPSACGAIPDSCASACDFLAGNCNVSPQEEKLKSEPCLEYQLDTDCPGNQSIE